MAVRVGTLSFPMVANTSAAAKALNRMAEKIGALQQPGVEMTTHKFARSFPLLRDVPAAVEALRGADLLLPPGSTVKAEPSAVPDAVSLSVFINAEARPDETFFDALTGRVQAIIAPFGREC